MLTILLIIIAAIIGAVTGFLVCGFYRNKKEDNLYASDNGAGDFRAHNTNNCSLERKTEQIKQLEDELENSRGELYKSRREILENDNKIKVLQIEKEELTRFNSQLDAQIELLKNELKEYKEACATLKSEISRLKSN